MFAVVLMSGFTQLLVWNFVSDYPGIVSNFKREADITGLTVYRWPCPCYMVSSGSPSGLWRRLLVCLFLRSRLARWNNNLLK